MHHGVEMEDGSRLWYYTLNDACSKKHTANIWVCAENALCADPVIETNKHQKPLKRKETFLENQLNYVLIENYSTPTKCDVGSLEVLEPEFEPKAIGFEDKPSTVKAIK